MNRFVTADETSCHLDITDGLGRFRFVSRGDQKPEKISVPMPHPHATPAVVRRAHELGIILFLMPPNCTNILQGEDLVNFGIFNNDYNKKKLHHVSLIKAGHASVVETLSTLLA